MNRKLITIISILLLIVVQTSQSSAGIISTIKDRPFNLFVPTTYKTGTAAPLIIALHGYSSSPEVTESRWGLDAVAEKNGVLVAYPGGTTDLAGNRYWNATPACCDLGKSNINDEAFIISVIDEISKIYQVDQKRIYLLGHSNGGFMSYRMACKRSDRFAAIVSVAGAMYVNSTDCVPNSKVSILQIHGTSDATILFDGGTLGGNPFPSAKDSLSKWAKIDGCTSKLTLTKSKLDLDRSISGSESTVSKYSGCKSGTSVELWTINNGVHVPKPSITFAYEVMKFLLSKSKNPGSM
jgi:polyhydroxybutyrate depolymerase